MMCMPNLSDLKDRGGRLAKAYTPSPPKETHERPTAASTNIQFLNVIITELNCLLVRANTLPACSTAQPFPTSLYPVPRQKNKSRAIVVTESKCDVDGHLELQLRSARRTLYKVLRRVGADAMHLEGG